MRPAVPIANGAQWRDARAAAGLPPLDDLRDALPRLFEILASVVAPTTLLTALLLYFGRVHLTWFFQHFGVNYTAMNLTPQDYLVRAADGLFVPVAVAAAMTLVVLWLRRILLVRLAPDALVHLVRTLGPALAVAGVVLVGLAVAGVLRPSIFARAREVPGLALAVGVVVLAYASRLLRLGAGAGPGRVAGTPPPAVAVAVAEWGAVFVLVSIGLFWAVGNYAAYVGAGRGHDMQAALPAWPDTSLYSEQRLHLDGPGVWEITCSGIDAAYRFRYDGLKLVLQSGDQYLFLPGGWSPSSGAAVLIPRSDTMRLEFRAVDASAPPASC